MRIVYMGTPDFSVPALEKLISAGHEVVGVVTQPDKPKGRGGKMQFTPVKEAALKHDINVYQPVKVREAEFVETLKELAPDVIVVTAFGQILTKEILDVPQYGCINIHASLLPKYRGAAPIQFSIIDGEKETGITTMYMSEGLDTGDIIEVEKITIDDDETGGSLHDKLSETGGRLILSTLEKLENNTAERIVQDDSKSTYVGMINKNMGKIDFTKSAEEIERLVRGLNPWPSAFTSLDGKTLKIWKAQVVDEEVPGQTGEIVKVSKTEMLIKTGKGLLSIQELQLEGKKRMEVSAFLRGYTVKEGTVCK